MIRDCTYLGKVNGHTRQALQDGEVSALSCCLAAILSWTIQLLIYGSSEGLIDTFSGGLMFGGMTFKGEFGMDAEE